MRCNIKNAVFGFVIAFSSLATSISMAQVECSTVAVYKYKAPSGEVPSCKITIDRAAVGSPLPVQVPPKTRVFIVVKNQQPNEIIQAAVTSDAAAKPDVAGDILSKLATPLGSLSISQTVVGRQGLLPTGPNPGEPLERRQESLYERLAGFYGAYIEPACLQSYAVFNGAAASCSTSRLASADDFDKAKAKAIADIDATINATLPPPELEQLDSDVMSFCRDMGSGASSECQRLTGNENRIRALADTLATKKASATNPLSATKNTLILLQDQPQTVLQPYMQESDRKLTIKVSGIEQIGNTPTAIATVVVTWQQTNWSLSTGVVLSALRSKSFADAPIYGTNGLPVTDGSGKTLTVVTVSKTLPGIISPVVFVNYRLHNFQVDNGRWAFLFSGGIGANIVTKSADFAGGPTLQFGNIFFTGAVHYGRQTNLTDGVHVGDQLGTSPPALPTSNPYKPAVGIGITYRIPLM